MVVVSAIQEDSGGKSILHKKAKDKEKRMEAVISGGDDGVCTGVETTEKKKSNKNDTVVDETESETFEGDSESSLDPIFIVPVPPLSGAADDCSSTSSITFGGGSVSPASHRSWKRLREIHALSEWQKKNREDIMDTSSPKTITRSKSSTSSSRSIGRSKSSSSSSGSVTTMKSGSGPSGGGGDILDSPKIRRSKKSMNAIMMKKDIMNSSSWSDFSVSTTTTKTNNNRKNVVLRKSFSFSDGNNEQQSNILIKNKLLSAYETIEKQRKQIKALKEENSKQDLQIKLLMDDKVIDVFEKQRKQMLQILLEEKYNHHQDEDDGMDVKNNKDKDGDGSHHQSHHHHHQNIVQQLQRKIGKLEYALDVARRCTISSSSSNYSCNNCNNNRSSTTTTTNQQAAPSASIIGGGGIKACPINITTKPDFLTGITTTTTTTRTTAAAAAAATSSSTSSSPHSTTEPVAGEDQAVLLEDIMYKQTKKSPFSHWLTLGRNVCRRNVNNDYTRKMLGMEEEQGSVVQKQRKQQNEDEETSSRTSSIMTLSSTRSSSTHSSSSSTPIFDGGGEDDDDGMFFSRCASIAESLLETTTTTNKKNDDDETNNNTPESNKKNMIDVPL